MYVPKYAEVHDRAVVLDLMRRFDFAALISAKDGVPCATHVPVVVRDDVLYTHVARQNPQWRELGAEALVIFQGPHSYISPSWYATPRVPTWNYMVVHAYARPRIIEDKKHVREILEELVRIQEARFERPWDMGRLAGEYIDRLIGAIVAIELSITRLEANFKLGQNGPIEDRRGVVAALEDSPREGERAIADAMRRI